MGEIYKYFKDQTLSQISLELRGYTQRAQSILQKLDQEEFLYATSIGTQMAEGYYYGALNKNIKIDEEGNEKISFKATKQSNKIRDYLIKEREQINQTYIEGYVLLNEIGKYFHKAWNYTIVMYQGNDMYNFTMSQSEFLKYITFDFTGAKLKSFSNKLFNTFNEQSVLGQMKKTQWNGKGRYDISLFNNYKDAIDRARIILINGHEHVPKYNKGQIIEGYFGYTNESTSEKLKILQNMKSIVEKSYEEHLGEAFDVLKSIYSALSQQTNSRGFWSGGDTKQQGQIKGAGASVFNFSTIRNQLEKVIYLFNNLDFSKLENYINNAKGKAKQSLLKASQQILNDVITAFDQTNLSLSANDIQDQINSIINKQFKK